MSVGCGFQASSDERCGIDAIGRCSKCKSPFCLTHQAREIRHPFRTYVDLCSACLAATERALANLRSGVHQREEEAKRWVQGTGPAFLRARNVPLTQLYRREWQKKRFSQGKYVLVPSTVRGWILGDVIWHASGEGHAYAYNWTEAVPTFMDDDATLSPVAESEGRPIKAEFDRSEMRDTYVKIESLIRQLGERS
jgi:hypothetical protein